MRPRRDDDNTTANPLDLAGRIIRDACVLPQLAKKLVIEPHSRHGNLQVMRATAERLLIDLVALDLECRR